MAQLCLEERPDDFVSELIAFYRQVGLPVSLADLGFKGDESDAIRIIAERTVADAPYVQQF